MSREWDEFLPLVLPDLPGCPKALALAAVKRATVELCRSAYVWIQDLGPMDVISGQAEYDCPLPSGSVPVIMLSLTLNGLPLRAATAEELDENHPGWTALMGSRPTRYLVPALGRLRLAPIPSQDLNAALVPRMALAPAQDAAGVEDLIFEQWAAAVAHGAKAELLMLRGKAWTEPTLAEHHARQFRLHVQRARGKSSSGWTGATLTARPRTFGG